MRACHVPAGGFDRRISRAKICLTCGYIHPRDEAMVPLCRHCGATLDGANSQFPQRLFEQPTVKASRWVRISSEEEERAREGYHITTHFCFSPGTTPDIVMVKKGGDSDAIMEVTYVPQADLWRINHGWRRSADRNGFSLESSTGEWVKRKEDLEENEGAGLTGPIIPGVKPFVTDNRNILLLRPLTHESSDPSFLKTLAYAFQRGIQVIYQVEEQEVAVELIGKNEHERILLWEAAEGGTGVWDRILNEKRSFAEIAREALRICHFDPATGEEVKDQAEPCGRACYDCLLSYANQMDHRLINRKAVKDFLLELGQAEIISMPRVRTYEEHYQWLSQRLDRASSLEKEFLDYLHANKLRLPDFAQHCPENEIAVQSDFYYQRDKIPGICVFIDGPAHDNPEQAKYDQQVRESLKHKGYRVIAIRYDRPFGDQIEGHKIFEPV